MVGFPDAPLPSACKREVVEKKRETINSVIHFVKYMAFEPKQLDAQYLRGIDYLQQSFRHERDGNMRLLIGASNIISWDKNVQLCYILNYVCYVKNEH